MSQDENKKIDDNGHGNDRLKITIITPAGKWPEAHFEPSSTVNAVIAATLEHFKHKLNPDDAYELRKKDSETALDGSASLLSLGVQDGEVFLLVKSTIGGGK